MGVAVCEGGGVMVPRFRAWDKANKIMRLNDEIVIWNNQVYINEKKKGGRMNANSNQIYN